MDVDAGEEEKNLRKESGDKEPSLELGLEPLQTRMKTLVEYFKKGKIDCPICLKKIYNDNKIWNCDRCSQPFHLTCIKKWILSTN